MPTLLSFHDAVDIGGGRGRLAAPAAASLRRVDAQFRSAFGRAADINEAWRSPEDADENYRKYQRYLNGGPWAPIAFPAKDSIHCRGYAVDTDDTSAAQMRIWNDNGWYWTVYRNGKLAERWHLEYFPERDNRRNDPTPAGGGAAVPTAQEGHMIAAKITDGNGIEHHAIISDGSLRHLIDADDPEWMKNVCTTDDRWTPVPIQRLPSVLRSFACDLHIWDIRNGSFVVLDPLTGNIAPGMLWSAVNASRSQLARIEVTSAETAAYVEELAKAEADAS